MGFLDKLLGRRGPRQVQTVAEAMALFESCGIRVRPDLSLQQLIENEGSEESRFLNLKYLAWLIGDESDWFIGFPGINAMGFDTEKIEDQECYAEILSTFSRICEGLLQFTDVIDEVECDTDAFLELSCNGSRYRVEFHQENDWFAPEVMSLLEALVKRHGRGKRLAYIVDEPDDFVHFLIIKPQDAARLGEYGLELEVTETDLPLDGVTLL
ncbi:hypothetical protein KDL44_00025 [bacterium]|nr:hypothetical protein [bacterium]